MPRLHLPSLHITAQLWWTEDGFRTAIPGNLGKAAETCAEAAEAAGCVTSQHHFLLLLQSGHLRISEAREGDGRPPN